MASKAPSKMLPFPTSLTIGTDICKTSRILSILTGKFGKRFLRRLFTPTEFEAYNLRLAPAITITQNAGFIKERMRDIEAHIRSDVLRGPAKGKSKLIADFHDKEIVKGVSSAIIKKTIEFIAGRFAAKEAVFKAHPGYNLSFQDVEIHTHRLPHLTWHSRLTGTVPYAIVSTQRTPLWTHEFQEAQVSISHDGSYATAVCLGFRPPISKSVVGITREMTTHELITELNVRFQDQKNHPGSVGDVGELIQNKLKTLKGDQVPQMIEDDEDKPDLFYGPGGLVEDEDPDFSNVFSTKSDKPSTPSEPSSSSSTPQSESTSNNAPRPENVTSKADAPTDAPTDSATSSPSDPPTSPEKNSS